MKTREEKINNAVSVGGFEYNGVFYRALSTRTLMFLERFKSPYYFGGDQLKGLMDLLYISSHDPKEVQKIPLEQFDEIIYDYADTFTTEDLANLAKIAKESNEDNSSTVIEVKQEDSKKKP